MESIAEGFEVCFEALFPLALCHGPLKLVGREGRVGGKAEGTCVSSSPFSTTLGWGVACENEGAGLPGSEANIYFPSGWPLLTSLDSCETENANFLVVLPALNCWI